MNSLKIAIMPAVEHLRRRKLKQLTVLLAFITCAAFLPALTFGAAAPWQQPYTTVTGLDFREADRRISYGAAPQQFVDLWLPSGADAPAPVAVLIHGGCWLSDYDIAHVRPLATALADAGFAVWGVEYRRVGNAGGGWTGTFDDVASAIDLLSSVEDDRLDVSRVAAVGHSAGGHLALWLAARPSFTPAHPMYTPTAQRLRGAVGLAAITNLVDYARGDSSCQRVTPRLLGGSSETWPERYLYTSPVSLPAGAPVTLLQGTADRIVSTDQAAAMPGARVIHLEGAGHFDLVHPHTQAFPQLVKTLQEMLTP
ncbi:MAG: alpha/beta fold hydrolase [Halioglobus sp.]